MFSSSDSLTPHRPVLTLYPLALLPFTRFFCAPLAPQFWGEQENLLSSLNPPELGDLESLINQNEDRETCVERSAK